MSVDICRAFPFMRFSVLPVSGGVAPRPPFGYGCVLPFTGRGSISGTVYCNNVPVPYAAVYLYDVASGVLARKVTTDANGHYVFSSIIKGRKYTTLAHDPAYNAAVADWLDAA